ncbi:hypothetical protein BDR04DRAFT_1088415 [Suillus decipiens]|nr:hypothetical protein BDR04DRAFT_1088415 [Suillus decipiens]
MLKFKQSTTHLATEHWIILQSRGKTSLVIGIGLSSSDSELSDFSKELESELEEINEDLRFCY